jgi:DNA-binding MarR family transcriptional regulator
MTRGEGTMSETLQDLTGEEYQALGEVRYQIRRFLRFSEQAARAAGIEPQQHQLLLVIRTLPPGEEAAIGVLAERMQLAHHSTVELLDRLMERGLIERRRSEEDRRRVLVSLTPAGADMLRRVVVQTSDVLRQAGPDLIRALHDLISAHPLPDPPLAAEPAAEGSEHAAPGAVGYNSRADKEGA